MKNQIKKFISSRVDFHDIYNAVNIANDLDVGLEISRFGKLKNIEMDFDATLDLYKDAVKDLKNDLTFHGFFSNLSVVSKDPLIKEASVKRYYQSLEIASELGAKTVVFHTCFNNLLKMDMYKKQYFQGMIEFFNEIVPHFEKAGIVATIENVHEPDSEMIRNLIAAINSPYLKATIDIGHCNLHSDICVSDWIKDYGIMLHHMHFHNNFKEEDSHSSLKNGNLEIKPILKTIKDMQIHPQIVLEIFNEDDVRESIEYLNKLEEEVWGE